MDHILPAQDMSERQAAANTLINLSFSQNAGYFRLRKNLLLMEDSGPSVRKRVFVNYCSCGLSDVFT